MVHYSQVHIGDAAVGVSPATMARLHAKAAQQKQGYFSSQDVAVWLGGTERHARRILHALEEGKVIEQAGEEQGSRRGRPRKVFRFLNG
ncbi:hypothetical protein JCM19046_3681 [Bacillus sp. JCM 19046]|nr:hypothetical protein JCM19045_1713 [Bacillus sp. JCM 19045]GAF19055.1 hypothetical protein JCM19046_3681 [Bacillus sp. JCM 19046]